MVEITAMMSQATREADPTAFRVVNNCCLWAEYVATRMTNNTPLERPSRTPLEYMKAVRDAKVDYDAVGLQIYAPGRDMLEIERHIERFTAAVTAHPSPLETKTVPPTTRGTPSTAHTLYAS